MSGRVAYIRQIYTHSLCVQYISGQKDISIYAHLPSQYEYIFRRRICNSFVNFVSAFSVFFFALSDLWFSFVSPAVCVRARVKDEWRAVHCSLLRAHFDLRNSIC